MHTSKSFFFSKVVKSIWNDLESDESKEKSNFKFFRFYFLSYGHFCDVITPIFDEFFTKTHVWPNVNLFTLMCEQIYGEFPTFLFLNSHLLQPRHFYRLSAYRILKLFSFVILLNQPEVRICYNFLAINFLVVTPRSIFCVRRELDVRYF